MYWDQLTSEQIHKIDRNIPAIIPISATEQHGAHLPVGTDRMIADHFCNLVDIELSKQILILPTISVGCSEHHLSFAGSLSVQHSSLLNQLLDISSCVVSYGFKNILIFNSHGGNQAIGQSFVEIFGHRNPSANIVMITWWKIALEKLLLLNESGAGGTGHAGEFETSLMLHIAPQLVNSDKIGSITNEDTFKWATGDMLSPPRVSFYRSMKDMTPSGVFGDANFGSREKGVKISEIVVQSFKTILVDLYRHSKKE